MIVGLLDEEEKEENEKTNNNLVMFLNTSEVSLRHCDKQKEHPVLHIINVS